MLRAGGGRRGPACRPCIAAGIPVIGDGHGASRGPGAVGDFECHPAGAAATTRCGPPIRCLVQSVRDRPASTTSRCPTIGSRRRSASGSSAACSSWWRSWSSWRPSWSACSACPSWCCWSPPVLGVAAVVRGGYVVTRRVAVVRLDPTATGSGWSAAPGSPRPRWTEVEEAVTATAAAATRSWCCGCATGGRPRSRCTLLAADREEFVRDLLAHLQRGQGLRPL